MRSVLLLLADGRLPAGGHVHSGGVEQAIAEGWVHDCTTLEQLCRSRLWSAGLTAAALAAAATSATTAAELSALDTVADARTPSPAQRAASRAQGRALVRLARSAWPSPLLDALVQRVGSAPHHAVVIGVVAATSGLRAADAALTAALGSVAAPASAAVRLLGLDPAEVTALQVRLAAEIDAVAGLATDDPSACPGSPGLDLLAEHHAQADVPLFAS